MAVYQQTARQDDAVQRTDNNALLTNANYQSINHEKARNEETDFHSDGVGHAECMR